MKSQTARSRSTSSSRQQRALLCEKDVFQGITDPVLLRMCHRAGIKRVAAPVYNALRYDILRDYLLDTVLREAVILATLQHRTTITLADIQFTLRRHRLHMFGFGLGPTTSIA